MTMPEIKTKPKGWKETTLDEAAELVLGSWRPGDGGNRGNRK